VKISSSAVGHGRIGDRIRRARRAAKLSQTALAERVGVTASAVAQWEHPDGTSPVLSRLQAIATATAVSFEWLATGRGSKSQAQHDKEETPALKLDLFALDDTEEMLLRRFRMLPPGARGALVSLLDQLMRSRRKDFAD
jgi:transcriptional regulator with XRE-family HTH domain